MAYFPNGTAGAMYEEQYCVRCIHGQYEDPEAEGCAVWSAHLLYSYDLCNEEKNPLEILIPTAKDGITPLQCKMFIEKESA